MMQVKNAEIMSATAKSIFQFVLEKGFPMKDSNLPMRKLAATMLKKRNIEAPFLTLFAECPVIHLPDMRDDTSRMNCSGSSIAK